jgi:hypothetical protein
MGIRYAPKAAALTRTLYCGPGPPPILGDVSGLDRSSPKGSNQPRQAGRSCFRKAGLIALLFGAQFPTHEGVAHPISKWDESALAEHIDVSDFAPHEYRLPFFEKFLHVPDLKSSLWTGYGVGNHRPSLMSEGRHLEHETRWQRQIKKGDVNSVLDVVCRSLAFVLEVYSCSPQADGNRPSASAYSPNIRSQFVLRGFAGLIPQKERADAQYESEDRNPKPVNATGSSIVRVQIFRTNSSQVTGTS